MNDTTHTGTETPPQNGKLRRFVGRCRELWKELTGDNPMPRLHLVFTMSTVIGALGVFGILFGILGAILILGSPPSDTVTWSKVGDVLAKSFLRVFLGYGSAAVIHAVVKLYEKQNPPNDQAESELPSASRGPVMSKFIKLPNGGNL